MHVVNSHVQLSVCVFQCVCCMCDAQEWEWSSCVTRIIRLLSLLILCCTLLPITLLASLSWALDKPALTGIGIDSEMKWYLLSWTCIGSLCLCSLPVPPACSFLKAFLASAHLYLLTNHYPNNNYSPIDQDPCACPCSYVTDYIDSIIDPFLLGKLIFWKLILMWHLK